MVPKLRLFVWIFGLVGCGLLVGAGWALWATLSFRARAASAPGVIVDNVAQSSSKGGWTYAPVYEFTDAAGQRHRVRSSSSSSPPAYDVGEAVTVRYDPQRPERARLDGFLDNWLGPTILGGMGIVFSGFAAGFAAPGILSRRRREYLVQRGMRVDAKVVGVDLDTSFAVNGRHPWRIHAQWLDPQSNTMRTFRSDMLWFDPSELTPEQVAVWVDPQKPARHWMDTSFLPREG